MPPPPESSITRCTASPNRGTVLAPMPTASRHRNTSCLALVCFAIAAIFLSGCESTGGAGSSTFSKEQGGVANSQHSDLHAKALTLKKGADINATRVLLGEPQEAKSITNDTGVWDRWVYKNDLVPLYRQVVTEMEEVPFIDPINGNEMTLLEPRAGHQRIERRETVTLTFRDGGLFTLTRHVDQSTSFPQ